MNKEQLQERARELEIEIDGRWSEKRLKQEIEKATALEHPATEEQPEPEAEPKPEQTTERTFIESKDLLKALAEQRKKTGKLMPYANQGKPKRRKNRSKIHGNAVSTD